MTALPLSQQQPQDNGCLLKLAALALLVSLTVALAVISGHALERHGLDAVWVKTCQENAGNLETWVNPTTGRQAHIVCLPEGKFGLEICEATGEMVTCFVKEKLKRLEQVYNYLRNRGYQIP